MSKNIKENKPAPCKLLKNKIKISKLITSFRYDKVTIGYKGGTRYGE